MNKVLLIDDDVELVGMFQEYLEQEGFEVATAHNGETGAASALTDRAALRCDIWRSMLRAMVCSTRETATSPSLSTTGERRSAQKRLRGPGWWAATWAAIRPSRSASFGVYIAPS